MFTYVLVLTMKLVLHRSVARSENLGGHIELGGDNVPPLVEIGLTDLAKSGGHVPPWPPACDGPDYYDLLMNFLLCIM